MKQINETLKRNDIRALGYKKVGKVIVADTNIGKLVIKENKDKDYIYNYLNTRSFNYYPEIIESDKYIISKYIEDVDIPKEQKILDLIDLVSLMHSKTTHYKEVSVDEYKQIYEDLSNNYQYLYEYYLDTITFIDDKVFMSPKEYTLAVNISYIFKCIEIGKNYLESWKDKIDNLKKMRVTVVHNNLDLSHYITNNYLISWDKSKIDMPIFDLYNLYNNHNKDFSFLEILKRYESDYPLKDYERDLLFILITMPKKIEFDDTEYNMCIKITDEIERIKKTHLFIEEYKKLVKN